MMMNPIRLVRALGAVVLAATLCVQAGAQEFPNKPITLICPFPAGGSTDQYLRTLAALA